MQDRMTDQQIMHLLLESCGGDLPVEILTEVMDRARVLYTEQGVSPEETILAVNGRVMIGVYQTASEAVDNHHRPDGIGTWRIPGGPLPPRCGSSTDIFGMTVYFDIPGFDPAE